MSKPIYKSDFVKITFKGIREQNIFISNCLIIYQVVQEVSFLNFTNKDVILVYRYTSFKMFYRNGKFNIYPCCFTSLEFITLSFDDNLK